MKISIIGSGNVGGTLGKRWSANHEVVFGVRKPDRSADRAERLNELTIPEALAWGDVIVLATPYSAALEILREAQGLTGKVIVDATNPIAPGRGGLLASGDSSGAEELQNLQRDAHVVKCFNSTGFNNMADPCYPNGNAVMFLCGGDAIAKTQVKRLSDELGFETIDAGPLAMARYLEALAMLWIKLAYTQGQGREFAFILSKR